MLAHPLEFVAVPSVEGPCPHNCSSIPVPLLDLSDSGTWFLPEVPVSVIHAQGVVLVPFPPRGEWGGQKF